MYRWLPDGKGSDRDKVLGEFRKRLDEIAKGGEPMQLEVGVALALIWGDFVREAGNLSDYAAAPRDTQKQLLVKLINYEFDTRDDGNKAESIAAELLTYLLAMVATKDAAAERELARPIEQLARIGDPGIRFGDSGN